MPISLRPEIEDYDQIELEESASRNRLVIRRTRSLTHLDVSRIAGGETIHTDPFDTYEDIHSKQADQDHPYSNSNIPHWQKVFGRTLTPTFKDFIYQGKPSKIQQYQPPQRERGLSQLGGLINKLKNTNQIPLPLGMNDGFDIGVESIIEDESSLNPRLPFHHKNLDDSLLRADDQEIEVADSSAMRTPYNFGGATTRPNQQSMIMMQHNMLTQTQRSNYIRIDTAHSHENSPKHQQDLVERVIEENFNWTKYYQVQVEINQSNGSSAPDDQNKTIQRDEQYFLARRNTMKAHLKKQLSILPFLEEPINPMNSSPASAITNGSGDQFIKKRLSAAQIIAFTEKSVGIFSERNRDPQVQANARLPIQNDSLIEEVEDENVISVTTSNGGGGLEEHKVTHSSYGEESSYQSSIRPSTKVVNYKCLAKSSGQEQSSSEGGSAGCGVQITKTSVQKRGPNDNHKAQSTAQLPNWDGPAAQYDSRRLKSSFQIQSDKSPQKLEFKLDQEGQSMFKKLSANDGFSSHSSDLKLIQSVSSYHNEKPIPKVEPSKQTALPQQNTQFKTPMVTQMVQPVDSSPAKIPLKTMYQDFKEHIHQHLHNNPLPEISSVGPLITDSQVRQSNGNDSKVFISPRRTSNAVKTYNGGTTKGSEGKRALVQFSAQRTSFGQMMGSNIKKNPILNILGSPRDGMQSGGQTTSRSIGRTSATHKNTGPSFNSGTKNMIFSALNKNPPSPSKQIMDQFKSGLESPQKKQLTKKGTKKPISNSMIKQPTGTLITYQSQKGREMQTDSEALAGLQSEIRTMQSSVTEFDVEHMPGMNHSIISLEAQHTELMNLDNNPQILPEYSESSSQKQVFIQIEEEQESDRITMVQQSNKNAKPFVGGLTTLLSNGSISPSYGIFGNPPSALSNGGGDLTNKSAGKQILSLNPGSIYLSKGKVQTKRAQVHSGSNRLSSSDARSGIRKSSTSIPRHNQDQSPERFTESRIQQLTSPIASHPTLRRLTTTGSKPYHPTLFSGQKPPKIVLQHTPTQSKIPGDSKKPQGPIHMQISLTSPNDQDDEDEGMSLRKAAEPGQIGEKLQELKILSEAQKMIARQKGNSRATANQFSQVKSMGSAQKKNVKK